MLIFLSFILHRTSLSMAEIELPQSFLVVLIGVIANMLFVFIIYPLLGASYRWVMKFEHRREQKI